MIKSFCKTELKELQKYKTNNRDDIFLENVKDRLATSFEAYQSDLTSGLDYLKRRNEIRVLRKLNKLHE